MEEELIHRIALTFANGVGSVSIRNLLSSFGSAKNVLSQKSATNIQKVNGIGPKLSQSILDAKSKIGDAEKIYLWCQKNEVEILSLWDSNFPTLLKNIPAFYL